MPRGTVQKPRFYAGLSPTVPFSHLRPWGNLGLALSAPYGGTLACRLGQALNGAHWAPAPPKGGGETRLCANFLRRTYLALPLGPLRPGGTLPSGRSPLPRRSVLDVCHWQTAPEAAGESGLALARTERASCQPHRPLPWLSLSGRCFLGVHPSGKGGAKPLFP